MPCKRQPPEAAAGVQAHDSERKIKFSPQLLTEFTSSNGKDGVALMRRSGEHARDIQDPSTPGGSAKDSMDPLDMIGGPLLVPLVHGEGGWAIDWDALRFAAHPPQLAPGLPLEVFKVRAVGNLE